MYINSRPITALNRVHQKYICYILTKLKGYQFPISQWERITVHIYIYIYIDIYNLLSILCWATRTTRQPLQPMPVLIIVPVTTGTLTGSSYIQELLLPWLYCFNNTNISNCQWMHFCIYFFKNESFGSASSCTQISCEITVLLYNHQGKGLHSTRKTPREHINRHLYLSLLFFFF